MLYSLYMKALLFLLSHLCHSRTFMQSLGRLGKLNPHSPREGELFLAEKLILAAKQRQLREYDDAGKMKLSSPFFAVFLGFFNSTMLVS